VLKYGFARVSTTEHDHAAQVDELKAAGAVKVLSEGMSGVRADRPSLPVPSQRSTRATCSPLPASPPGAHRARDLLNIVHEIEVRGATFESIAEPWANTNTPQAAAMLTMLSAFAQLDRAFILSRTKEGRERAKAQGLRFGPEPKLSKEQIAHARDLQGEGRACGRLARFSDAMQPPCHGPYMEQKKKRRSHDRNYRYPGRYTT